VALLTELFQQLAELKPKLRPTVLGVFIANEENWRSMRLRDVV